eukprot:jgi/Mesen1/8325/ME000457S07515
MHHRNSGSATAKAIADSSPARLKPGSRSSDRSKGNMASVAGVSSILTHVVGVLVLVLVIVWSVGYRGGVGWFTSNKALIFNWHPILMVTGLIFITGEGVLVYRLLPGSKQVRKIVHSTLNGVALVLGIVGVTAAFRYHNESVPAIDNLYSLHSWVGLTTLVLFGVQWIAGLVTFLYPGASNPVRTSALPWHTFLGVFLYILALVSAELGILEKVTFLQSGKVIGHYAGEAILANWLGLLILLLGALVVLTATRIDKAHADEAYVSLD